MLTLTALLPTHNDALRLGRCLETVYPCDRIVIVDHGSSDDTVAIARDYGALVTGVRADASPSDYIRSDSGWILCLDPRESVSESLAADLYQWKLQAGTPQVPAFSVFLREETADGWVQVPQAQTRLVPPGWNRWQEFLPQDDSAAVALEGELLRFRFP